MLGSNEFVTKESHMKQKPVQSTRESDALATDQLLVDKKTGMD